MEAYLFHKKESINPVKTTKVRRHAFRVVVFDMFGIEMEKIYRGSIFLNIYHFRIEHRPLAGFNHKKVLSRNYDIETQCVLNRTRKNDTYEYEYILPATDDNSQHWKEIKEEITMCSSIQKADPELYEKVVKLEVEGKGEGDKKIDWLRSIYKQVFNN